MLMSSGVVEWLSVKGSRDVVCLNKADGIMGVKRVPLSAVMLLLLLLSLLMILGVVDRDSLGYMRYYGEP